MQDYPNQEQEYSSGSDLPRPRKYVTGGASNPEPPHEIPPAFSQAQVPVQPKPVDLPPPKLKKPDAPAVKKPETAAKKPDAPVVKKPESAAKKPIAPAAKKPETDSAAQERKSYGKDTMQFRTPFRDTEFDTEFERRRAAPLPQRQANQKPAAPARSSAPQKKPQHSPQPVKPQQRKAVQPAQKPAKPKKRRRNPVAKWLRGIAATIAAVFLLYSCVALLLISRLEHLPAGKRLVTDGTLHAAHVTSVLLIGTDARDASERGRSDSMILVSLNSKTRTMYMTSFMRDAYVQIPDHGKDKLNAAYAYGGAELLMDTLEQNYGVSVDHCLNVSFTGFAGIIDAFGGVDITMSDAEARALNEILISEVNGLMGDAREADLLESGGSFRLSGKQALSYARIRYVGNADFERTSRQREVMTQLFGNVRTRAVTAVPELLSSALPNVGTNMSTGELYLLSLRAPFVLGYETEQLQIPAEGTWSGQTVNGQSVLTVDFAENTRILQETVYATTK